MVKTLRNKKVSYTTSKGRKGTVDLQLMIMNVGHGVSEEDQILDAVQYHLNLNNTGENITVKDVKILG